MVPAYDEALLNPIPVNNLNNPFTSLPTQVPVTAFR